VIEQLDDNRLIRPRAEYMGPEYPNPYVPMDKTINGKAILDGFDGWQFGAPWWALLLFSGPRRCADMCESGVKIDAMSSMRRVYLDNKRQHSGVAGSSGGHATLLRGDLRPTRRPSTITGRRRGRRWNGRETRGSIVRLPGFGSCVHQRWELKADNLAIAGLVKQEITSSVRASSTTQCSTAASFRSFGLAK